MIAWLVQNAIVVIPLAVVVAMICGLLRPAPAVCHALWLLVLLKLLIPPVPVWRSAWLDEWFVAHRAAASPPRTSNTAFASRPSNAAAQTHSGITARVTEVLVVEPHSPVSEYSHDAEPNEAAITREPTSHATPKVVSNGGNSPAASATWQIAARALLSLWALGAAMVVLSHVRRVLRLRRALKQSRAPTASFSRELAVHCRLLRVPLPNARLCNGLPCPMVLALPQATLLWPAGLEDRLDEPGRRAVMLHELAHLKRRDHLTAWLEVAVTCLWWWHPVVWWARRQLRQYAELASDAWVVAQLPAERSHYAKALIDVCEFISLSPPAAAPAVGMSRGTRRTFERRLHMILRQRIAGRTSLLAWIPVLAGAVLMLPGFSTGQESAAPPAEATAASVGETIPGDDIPATATAPATPQAANDAASTSPAGAATDATTTLPATASTSAARARTPAAAKADEDLTDELRAVTRELASSRHQGLLETDVANRVERVLGQLFEQFRANGRSDEGVVLEAFAWILNRKPTNLEQAAWSQRLKADDAPVGKLITTLLHSSEFTDPPNRRQAAVLTPRPNTAVEPVSSTGTAAERPGVAASFRKARVQTLLRVVYDMPLDKAEVLAKFLNDNVKGEIEARKVGDGLVVTAEAGIQRTVAGIVSLMTGEPVTLDLGGGSPAGYATVHVPVYHDPKNPNVGPTTYYTPTPVVQPGIVPGEYPPPPAGKRDLRTRTVLEPDPTTGSFVPRTVLEERVPANAPADSRDRSLPTLLTPQPTKERTKESTESSKEPPASASDSSSVRRFPGGFAD
jgi:beta-lactamase regulating signal transducer with metallopeptidase domain